MDGLHFIENDKTQQELTPQLKLLFSRPGFEVMTQSLYPSCISWIAPADTPGLVEFFFVLSGRLELNYDGDVTRIVGEGESFYVKDIKSDIKLSTDRNTLLLYVCDNPQYNQIKDYYSTMEQYLASIDSKDSYTRHHSSNVMYYSTELFKSFNSKDMISMDDMVASSLFHDVGKCKIPAVIIKKKGKLTVDEYDEMKKHASYSADILRPIFNDRIANIVLCHHERLDGSGYPNGLKSEDIPFEAKVIAVADSFDAMTTKRSYNVEKNIYEAARELCDMSDKYDNDVARELMRLVESGQVDLIKQRKNALNP